MKKLLERAEDLNWWWSAWIEKRQDDRTYVEIGQHSPAGEDFYMVIDFKTERQCSSFLGDLESYYEDFDIDEHVEMWIEARRNGISGIPPIRVLVKDAEDIDDMIFELLQALRGMGTEDSACIDSNIKQDKANGYNLPN